MRSALSLSKVLDRGVTLRSHEAIAIVQTLIERLDASVAAARRPYGPPTVDAVELLEDGLVLCRTLAARPAVSEVAILLQALLPPGPVPGGLRYAIGRALLETDGPPFDSIEEFSGVLTRYEKGDRAAVVRDLYNRSGPEAARIPERRRAGARVDELRRQLREADRRYYENVVAFDAAARRKRGGWTRAPLWIAAGLAGTIALMAGAELMHRREAVALKNGRQPARVLDAPIPSTPLPGVARPVDVVSSPRLRTATSVNSDAAAPVVAALDARNRPVFSPSFGSNGTAMFFHTGRTGDAHSALMSADFSGAELRVMSIVDDGARNYHVRPSPDGRLIAFDSDRDGERAVYVAHSDGTKVRRLSGDGYAAVPTWAPDGQRLTFIRSEPASPKTWNLWLLDLDSNDLRRLTDYPHGQTWGASWFPDGRRLCYTHEDKVVVFDLATLRTQQFDSPIAHRLVRTPAVSPDGSKIIFQVYRHGAWMLDPADGTMRCVLTDPTAEEFAWAPDGRRVAFHSRRDGHWGIYVMSGG